MAEQWCPVCCSRHDADACPGELLASEPERHGWRANVETPSGVEAYGVLTAASGELWRSRILTYPNVLWLAPGLPGSIKFVGRTPQEAEQKAVTFILEHCRSRGYELRERVDSVSVGAVPADAGPQQAAALPERRKVRFLPIRFGLASATEPGGTGNLSTGGLFILTEHPIDSGRKILMSLEIERGVIDLEGKVVWFRREHRQGRAPGMGVRLANPPRRYVTYVRALP